MGILDDSFNLHVFIVEIFQQREAISQKLDWLGGETRNPICKREMKEKNSVRQKLFK